METEQQPPKNEWIDKMNGKEALKVMLQSQSESIDAIRLALDDILKVSEAIYNKLDKVPNSRIIYAGAGTSARICVQDGTELFPTFGWPKERIDFLVAGGLNALTESIENAEDNVEYGEEIVKKIKISESDVVIALSASGTTPFAVSVINSSNKLNALTIGIGNNVGTKLQKIANLSITLNTGYELLAGSTRLKAGTAQKICLNLISSLVMCKLGLIKNGLMINMIPTNKKLLDRKLKIKSYIQNQGS